MEELFGLDTDVLMVAMLVAFGLVVAAVGVLALAHRILLRIGLRNIPRRPTQTALIVLGLMLSTLIISAALGTGDTISYSIRSDVFTNLGPVDEVLVSTQGEARVGVGRVPYFLVQRFHQLQEQLADYDGIDGLLPGIGETAPVVAPRTRLNVGGMRVTAVDPAYMESFGPLRDLEGGPVELASLGPGEVFLNAKAAQELEVEAGDTVTMFVRGEGVDLRVRAVVQKGGLAGDAPTMLMPLAQAQELFQRQGQINSIFVSNRGDARQGALLSDEVTERLRGLLTSREVAARLKDLLGQEAVVLALRERADELEGALAQDVRRVASLLEGEGLTDELVSLLADDGVGAILQAAAEEAGGPQLSREVFLAYTRLKALSVQDVKRDLLDVADQAASTITSVFIIFGLFSMMAGVMLIFLIFVMLAAERKTEMGISRAIGMKRRHLVEAFVFEGLAYDLLSALVGALLGIGVGFALVTIMSGIFGRGDEDFVLVRHYTLRSFIISYCAGVVLTFVTVFFSSYRVSRLNIVTAIRDLPEIFEPSETGGRGRLILRALGRPLIFLWRALVALGHRRPGGFLLNGALALAWPLVWPWDVTWALLRVSGRALSRGWLTFLLGALLTAVGLRIGQAAPYSVGVTMAVIGAGLSLRSLLAGRRWPMGRQNALTAALIGAVALFWLGVGLYQAQGLTVALALLTLAFEGLRQYAMRKERAVRDPEARNAFTWVGLTLVLFWGTPLDALDFVEPRLNSNIEMFFISGGCMVAAAVWVIVDNSDLIIDGVTFLFSRFSRLRPVLKTAVAYPLSSRLRTGLTLAMLALVIFTLIVMSMMTTSFTATLEDVESVTGGWDIEARVNYNNPVEDMASALPAALGEGAADIVAVGGYTTQGVQVRQVGAGSPEWKTYRLRGAEPSFLEATGYTFRLTAPGFEDASSVWRALKDDPTLAVIDSFAVPRRGGARFAAGGPTFSLEGFYLDDPELPDVEVEVRDIRTGQVARLRVIGVLDLVTDPFAVIFARKDVLDGLAPEPPPVTTYRFRLREGADVPRVAKALEAAFLENGMETEVLAEHIAEDREQSLAINRLLQGFMASGLLVGIAALGVISFRAVVERRQHIGVLRAIGYRRRMVMASFLLESSFVALLGILLGVALGSLLSYNLVSFIGEGVPGLRFTVPWLQVGIIVGLAYAFSMLSTIVPARQASRIYPAEALRYE